MTLCEIHLLKLKTSVKYGVSFFKLNLVLLLFIALLFSCRKKNLLNINKFQNIMTTVAGFKNSTHGPWCLVLTIKILY